MLTSCLLALVKNTIRRDFMPKGAVVLAPDLHSVHKNCGIDSDAGISISTLREVFMWIDDSRERQLNQFKAPLELTEDPGKYLIEPDAVFLLSGENQSFRVMSTQRLKVHGV